MRNDRPKQSSVWLTQLNEDAIHLFLGLRFLCLDPAQLRACAAACGLDPDGEAFLLHLLLRVYHPLLLAGIHAPFAVVAHLAVGYALYPAERLRILDGSLQSNCLSSAFTSRF